MPPILPQLRKLQLSPLSAWLLALAAGGLLLLGRYDWSAATYRYSLRGYLASLFFFALFLPTLHHLLRHFLPGKTTFALVVTVMTGLYFSLPYHWLGLDSWQYRSQDILVITGRIPKRGLDWLPGQIFSFKADMPYELAFYGVIIALGLLAGWLTLRRQSQLGGSRRQVTWSLIFWVGLFLLIVGQTWLHTSQRSPYTYIPSYEESPENNYRYVAYLFPPRQGAVNADYGVFHILEEFFMGSQVDGDLGLIRRSFPFYITSQFSYFIPSFYVFLVFNILLWLAASACAYGFARPRWGQDAARFFALLVGSGSGFIMFAAQPMNYLAGYAVVIIVVYLFDRLVGDTSSGWDQALLFGVCLGLASLVYDIFFWYAFILLYSLGRRRNIKRVLLTLGMGLGIYLGFQTLIRGWLQVEVSNLTEQYLAESFANLLTWPGRTAGDWYVLLTGFIRRYFTHLANAFLFAPILLALGGTFGLRERGKGWEIFCLLVPSLLGVAFLHFTESRIAHLPRLTYPAYPGIYLLAAAALSNLQNWLKASGWRRIALVLPWVVLCMIIALNNSDVFGLPQLYYLLYWESGGIFK